MKFYSSVALALLAAPVMMASQSSAVDASVARGRGQSEEQVCMNVTCAFS